MKKFLIFLLLLIPLNSFAAGGQLLYNTAGTTTPKLTLNFEGIDGATTWTEEAQGLIPDSVTNAQLDTNDPQAGVSSLKISNGSLYYSVPGISADFTYTGYFRFHDISTSKAHTVINVSEPLSGIPLFDVTIYENSGTHRLSIYAYDASGNEIMYYNAVTALSIDVWHKVEFIVSGKVTTAKIDGVTIVTGTAVIDNPLLSVSYVGFYSNDPSNSLWVDTVALVVGTTPVPAPLPYVDPLCGENRCTPTTITFTASPDPGYTFVGWGGDCEDSSPNTTCVLNMNTRRVILYLFDNSSSGSHGTAQGGGAIIPYTCTPVPEYCFDESQEFTVTCTQYITNSGIDGFSTDAIDGFSYHTEGSNFILRPTFSVNEGNYTNEHSSVGININMKDNYLGTASRGLVNANFVYAGDYTCKNNLHVHKTGTGDGTVTGTTVPDSPAVIDIDCGDTCDVAYNRNATVTLTTVADASSTFAGWSGEGCSGTGDCVVLIDRPRDVYAEFAELTFLYTTNSGNYYPVTSNSDITPVNDPKTNIVSTPSDGIGTLNFVFYDEPRSPLCVYTCDPVICGEVFPVCPKDIGGALAYSHLVCTDIRTDTATITLNSMPIANFSKVYTYSYDKTPITPIGTPGCNGSEGQWVGWANEITTGEDVRFFGDSYTTGSFDYLVYSLGKYLSGTSNYIASFATNTLTISNIINKTYSGGIIFNQTITYNQSFQPKEYTDTSTTSIGSSWSNIYVATSSDDGVSWIRTNTPSGNRYLPILLKIYNNTNKDKVSTYIKTTAVDNLLFPIQAGAVTGFYIRVNSASKEFTANNNTTWNLGLNAEIAKDIIKEHHD
jgi:hypothetical protein